MTDRLKAEAQRGHQGRLAEYPTRRDFVVLDEVGYLPFARTGGQLLFHLISQLYEPASIIVTSNLVFGDWPTVFVETKMTSTLRPCRVCTDGDALPRFMDQKAVAEANVLLLEEAERRRNRKA